MPPAFEALPAAMRDRLGAYLDGGGRLIAFDPLGCDTDEAVLITQGSVAAAYFNGRSAPVDALIIGSIDETSKK